MKIPAWLSRWWSRHFERFDNWPEDKRCTICAGRIWWWQTSTRLYSLGMNRAHLDCAADFLRSELERRHVKAR